MLSLDERGTRDIKLTGPHVARGNLMSCPPGEARGLGKSAQVAWLEHDLVLEMRNGAALS